MTITPEDGLKANVDDDKVRSAYYAWSPLLASRPLQKVKLIQIFYEYLVKNWFIRFADRWPSLPQMSGSSSPCADFWKFSDPGDLWPETWHLIHWLHFWQLKTTILTITLCPLNKEWRGPHSQLLRCFEHIGESLNFCVGENIQFCRSTHWCKAHFFMFNLILEPCVLGLKLIFVCWKH